MTDSNGTALRPIDRFRENFEQQKDKILAVLPPHIDQGRYYEIATRAILTNPFLMECTPQSLFLGVSNAARLGLELDGVLGQAYLVPFKNKGAKEATLVPGYKGIKELAYRSERVAKFDWAVVREGDEFDYEKGTEQFLKHKPKAEENAKSTHYWCLAETTYGGKVFEVMTRAQIESHRNKYCKGHARDGSAWLTSFDAMALKTVALKTMRLLPLSAEVQTLIERATYAESPASFNEGELPDGSATPAEDLNELADEIGMTEAEKEAIRQQELAEAEGRSL